jgi:D-methionine transport system permease protein
MRQTDFSAFLPRLSDAIFETLLMVSVSFLLAGVIGILLGLVLYATRRGNLLENRVVFAVLNFVVNIVRPIPFLIVAVSLIPLTRLIMNTSIGPVAAIVPLTVVASVSIARIAESNPLRILFTIVVPEALGPLTLGMTYIFVALVDATAVAGVIGGGGLGDLAMRYGYQRFDWVVVAVIVVVLVVLVQFAQALGNWIARRVMH